MGERKRATIVEVEPSGLTWQKSSASDSTPESCVEAALRAGSALIRNSRDRHGARLVIPSLEWKALLTVTRTGSLDLKG